MSDRPARPALELRDVWFSYDRRTVLESVTLRVDRGEFLGIIGPNGGGKTTLVKLALGLLRPDRGEVRILGGTPEEARGRVGYVPQHPSFDRSYPIRVRDVVLMGRLHGGLRRGGYGPRDREAARSALARMELTARAERPIAELSGGELQRTLLARALAVEPEILLLDEPTASVDTRLGRAVYEHLQELAGDVTVVLVSHDIGVISSSVETVGCLNRRLFYHGGEELTEEMIEEAYGAPVDMVSHGVPGRLLDRHPDQRGPDSE